MAVTIRLLGGFEVALDGEPVPDSAWTRRQATSLVKVLALAPGRRRHRERVVESIWPGLSLELAAPRLHKAAHYARRAMGDRPDCLVLRNELVALFPDGDVSVDAVEFARVGAEARTIGSVEAAAAALAGWTGPLLPDDMYDEWTGEPRESLRRMHLDLLRQAGRWEHVLLEQPTDEQAHLAIVEQHRASGDLRAALRQLERLDQALRRELGTVASPSVQRLRADLENALHAEVRPSQSGVRLYGRKEIGDRLRARLEQAGSGRGGSVVVSGPPGVGKTAVLDLALALADRRGWRTGRGTASAVEGPWPYAPVLEALGDLCRQHPALLDGLDDVLRLELERGLSGRDVTWSGESGHQRFFVAAAELVRLAATGHGLLLEVDDLHEADEASWRLLHYLSRCAVSEPVVLVLAHRPTTGDPSSEVVASIAARDSGDRIDLTPLSESATRRLLADQFPDLEPDAVDRIWTVSAGLPYTVLELAAGEPAPGGLPALTQEAQRSLQRVALLGSSFTTDEFLAVSGLPEDEAYRHLEAGLMALVVVPETAGYRFRHALVREALMAAMPPYALAAARREAAEQLAALGASPARVAHQFIAAGLPSRAVPYVVRTVETAGALGAYRDALTLIEAVQAHAGPDELPHLLARRGDLLMALGDPEAVTAYREAVPLTAGTEHRLVRARLARAAAFANDLSTARAALAGLTLEDDAADGPILLARGNLAYFSGDIEAAWDIVARAHEQLQAPDDPWQLMDLVALQGLIAHQRGEWFERFHHELRRTQGRQQLATAVFDAHLCVAEYVLYGPVPYPELIADTEELRRRAAQAGALRGVAFAAALIGEAALMMGDLEQAERELTDAVALHRDIDASSGEAHSLQRLAEVRVAQGDLVEARALLQRALPLARFSVMSMHLLQRVYATMIAAAPDPTAARAAVDQAEATLGETDHCSFCAVMLAVPAAIACADVGDLGEARRHLAEGEASVARWPSGSWAAALHEVRAHLVRAEGRDDEARRLLDAATRSFMAAGHPLDARRCENTVSKWAADHVVPVGAGDGAGAGPGGPHGPLGGPA